MYPPEKNFFISSTYQTHFGITLFYKFDFINKEYFCFGKKVGDFDGSYESSQKIRCEPPPAEFIRKNAKLIHSELYH